MKKVFFIATLACLFFVLLGCVDVPVCGNSVCQSSEDFQSCPQDCSGPYLVEFRVNSDYTGTSPIESAKIVLFNKERAETMFTDVDGKASGLLPAGEYDLMVSKEGYEKYVSALKLNSNYSFDLVLEIAPTSCTDSDNGINVYEKGSAILNNGEIKTDECITSPITGVAEYYCNPASENTSIAVSYENCPMEYVCNNGACISPTDQNTL